MAPGNTALGGLSQSGPGRGFSGACEHGTSKRRMESLAGGPQDQARGTLTNPQEIRNGASEQDLILPPLAEASPAPSAPYRRDRRAGGW
jgi:hypothetical protein